MRCPARNRRSSCVAVQAAARLGRLPDFAPLSYTARGDITMPSIDAFYSINETKKSSGNQVHHNNRDCVSGNEIPHYEHRFGTGGHRLCDDCQRLNQQEC